MHNMIPAIAGIGAAPIVRVPAPELAYFKRALDAGAFGVMVPMVETKVWTVLKQGNNSHVIMTTRFQITLPRRDHKLLDRHEY